MPDPRLPGEYDESACLHVLEDGRALVELIAEEGKEAALRTSGGGGHYEAMFAAAALVTSTRMARESDA
jgi:hypothetical protein